MTEPWPYPWLPTPAEVQAKLEELGLGPKPRTKKTYSPRVQYPSRAERWHSFEARGHRKVWVSSTQPSSNLSIPTSDVQAGSAAHVIYWRGSYCGVEQPGWANRSHNQEVVGSNPTPATICYATNSPMLCMGRTVAIDDTLLRELTEDGLSQSQIASRLGITRQGVAKSQTRLSLVGKHQSTAVKVTDEELRDLYLVQGFGIQAISGRLGMAFNVVRRRLQKLGILDSSRQPQASGLPRRKRRLKSQEFLATTKRQRFIEENGIC